MLQIDRIIGIISYRCNDSSFIDFPQSFYEEAKLYASRKIARTFSLLSRHYTFTIDNPKDFDPNKIIQLKLHSFREEISVMINGKEYTRVDKVIKPKEHHEVETSLYNWQEHQYINEPIQREHRGDNYYQLSYGIQNYEFNYTNRSEHDRIDLFYTADITIDDFDDESITPIIPKQYDEEVIKYALLYIAEPAIAKFQGPKKEKYLTILQLNQNKTDLSQTGERQTWPTLKVFRVI
jgi:hypothetical protein